MNRIHPITNNRAMADFFAEGYRLSASALVYQRNLIDIWGDKSTNYLDLPIFMFHGLTAPEILW